MSDDAYMPASERWDYYGWPWACGRYDEIFESHAVLDSVAQEAIDALRIDPTLDHECEQQWRDDCPECQFVRKARAVLMRFDNLNKKAGTE